jgi:hypothetical protein
VVGTEQEIQYNQILDNNIQNFETEKILQIKKRKRDIETSPTIDSLPNKRQKRITKPPKRYFLI